MKKLTVNHKYMILQGLFWMMFCVGSGFISLILLDRGLENKEIGFVPAIFGTISALLQPSLGRLCDRSNRITWKHMMLFLSIPFLIVCIIMTFIPGKIVGVLGVGLLLLLVNTSAPFINSALSAYKEQGENINFGVARGIGSGMYALLALIIGNLTAKLGTKVVSVLGIIIILLYILTLLSLPDTKPIGAGLSTDVQSKSKGFIRKYPAFFIMFLAFLLMLTCHNILNVYHLQIIQFFGGDSKELGISMALMAIVELPVLFIFSFLHRKAKAQTWMLVAAFGYGIRCLCFALSGSVASIYASQFSQMLSFALFASASVFYTIDMVKPEDQVTGQAMMTMVMACGSVIGSMTGGFIIDLYGIRQLLFVNFGISCAGIVLALISVFVNRKKI